MSTTIVKTKICFISTYPPKKCGIASFTNDLINVINQEISDDTAIDVRLSKNYISTPRV